jgi:integral membrane sensor domain MASE1
LARLPLPDPAAIRRFLLIAGLTALAYALAGWLSLKLSTYVAGTVAAVWFAAGIGAAASLRYGASGVVGVLLGALVVNSPILPLEDAFRLALGAAAGAWIMGALPRHLQPFSSSLDYVSSVAKFALVAAPLGCAASALVGVFSLSFYGDLPAAMIFRGLWVWWLGHLLGVFLIAPLLLTAARWDLLPTNRAARLEALVLVVCMLGLTLVMMHYADPLRPAEIVLFVMVPAVLWAALRFTVTGASLAIFLAALIVMGVAVVSYGGITSATASDVFGLQVSMIAMALGGLFVSAALAERRYSEMRLDMLANHDPLTGLPNRSYFQDFLGHALARAQREKSQVSLLFIDLDRFKHINDTQGHDVGDQVLGIVLTTGRNCVPTIVARLGGGNLPSSTHPPACAPPAGWRAS